MKLKELKEKDRPRERLIEKGPEALTDIELLAIIIGSGSNKEDVFEIATKLTKKFSLHELKNVNYEALSKISGLKAAKASKILAVFELAKRAYIVSDEKIVLDSSDLIFNYVYGDYYLESIEKIVVVYLNCKLQPLKKSIFKSSSSFSVEFPFKAIVKMALDLNAYGIVITHNHPTGDIKPSTADLRSTYAFIKILDQMEIMFLDHLIVGCNSYYSFLNHGLLNAIDEYNDLGDGLEKIGSHNGNVIDCS